MSGHCEKCGQPIPDEPRKDPPLSPLPFPAVMTIHDLTAKTRAKAKVDVDKGGGVHFYRLRGAHP